MLPLKFIRMFHIGRGSLMESVLTFNTFILEKGTCYKQIILKHVSFLQLTCLRNVKFH